MPLQRETLFQWHIDAVPTGNSPYLQTDKRSCSDYHVVGVIKNKSSSPYTWLCWIIKRTPVKWKPSNPNVQGANWGITGHLAIGFTRQTPRQIKSQKNQNPRNLKRARMNNQGIEKKQTCDIFSIGRCTGSAARDIWRKVVDLLTIFITNNFSLCCSRISSQNDSILTRTARWGI